jgi:hypothetical protein
MLTEIIQSLGSTYNESGGLIGSKEGQVIDAFCFDKGRAESITEYIPDVYILQRQLFTWYKEGIVFKGFIHSHASCGELSSKDIHMARKIMGTNQLTSILMPVFVINSNKIIWYEVNEESVVHLNMVLTC